MGSVGRLTGFKCTSTLLLISSSDSLSKEDSRGDFNGFYNFKKRNLLAVCKNNSATFEETGHFAINAQLMPCLSELKNKEKMLIRVYYILFPLFNISLFVLFLCSFLFIKFTTKSFSNSSWN